MGKAPVEVRRKRFLLPLILLPVALVLAIVLGYRNGVGVGFAVAGASVVVIGIIGSFRSPPPSQAGKRDSAAIDFGGS